MTGSDRTGGDNGTGNDDGGPTGISSGSFPNHQDHFDTRKCRMKLLGLNFGVFHMAIT